MKSKWKKLPVVLIGIIAIAVCGCSNDLQELNQKRSSAAKENTESTETVRTGTWETAAQTPYGAYPELVTYTLGQMSGANNCAFVVADHRILYAHGDTCPQQTIAREVR